MGQGRNPRSDIDFWNRSMRMKELKYGTLSMIRPGEIEVAISSENRSPPSNDYYALLDHRYAVETHYSHNDSLRIAFCNGVGAFAPDNTEGALYANKIRVKLILELRSAGIRYR